MSRLAPRDVLSLGRFHRRPAAGGDEAAPGGRPTADPDVALWARPTGGRAAPAGDGFLVVTLALPHRAALVADDRLALAPEQVMNRCVRGVLGALRGLGVDATYPGLDLLTHDRRAIGTLAFVEMGEATLFHAILAATATLADGPVLLDRADPGGVVGSTFLGPGDVGSLAAAGAGRDELEPAAFGRRLAAGYGEAFGVETPELDDEVTATLADAYRDAPPEAPPPDPDGPPTARTSGLLGPVEAWGRVAGGRVAGLVLSGCFLAPAEAPARLEAALRGRAADAAEVERTVRSFLDRDRGYLLGLRPDDLVDLVRRALAP